MNSAHQPIFKVLVFLILTTSLACTKENIPDQTDNSFSRVHLISEKASAEKEADRLEQWLWASDFEPVGLYLPSGQTIEIELKTIQGNSRPKLLVGTYSRIKWQDRPKEYSLGEGINEISDPKGGLLYLRYITKGEPTGKTELTFTGGNPVPVYYLGETTNEEWLQMLDSLTYRDVIMVSERTIVVVREETAKKYKDLSQDDMLTTLDRISDIEDYISGIDSSSDTHKPNVHKQLIVETSDQDIFMAAHYRRIMIHNRAINKLMDPVEMATKAWGIWHEMGHMRQMVNWDWNEVDEVTVNIYSLAAKRGLGSNMVWLEGNQVWDDLVEYFQSPLDERNFNTSEMLGGKGRLAMFQQLWLAYGDEFYIKVHKLTREVKAHTPNKVDKMAYFMHVASRACGYNLNDFFTQWGFNIPREHFDALDALNFPDPTIDLIKLRQ